MCVRVTEVLADSATWLRAPLVSGCHRDEERELECHCRANTSDDAAGASNKVTRGQSNVPASSFGERHASLCEDTDESREKAHAESPADD